MNKYWGHFKTVTRHKWYVFKLMCKCGMPIQGLMHDMSKYSLTEFISSAKHFSGNRSPIDNEKDSLGYSIAWQHHKGHNPHHPEYWIDNVMVKGEECKALLMPKKYVIEMICDWVGAGMAYEKDEWTPQTPLNWYNNVGKHRRIHPVVLATAKSVFVCISDTEDLRFIDKGFIEFMYELHEKRYENVGECDFL